MIRHFLWLADHYLGGAPRPVENAEDDASPSPHASVTVFSTKRKRRITRKERATA